MTLPRQRPSPGYNFFDHSRFHLAYFLSLFFLNLKWQAVDLKKKKNWLCQLQLVLANPLASERKIVCQSISDDVLVKSLMTVGNLKIS